MKLFLVLAAAGFVLSLVIHVSTYFGVIPNGTQPAVWFLHVGIFVVFIPAVITAMKMAKGRAKNYWSERIRQFSPKWLQALVAIFFVYAIFNFFFSVFYLNEGGAPGIINGEMVLHNHGQIIRKLTPEEFQKHETYKIRGFSGHWMLFYSISLLILLAWERMQNTSNFVEPAADQGQA